MKFYLIIILVLISFSTNSGEVSGEYAAVTESHLSLELDLRKDSTVTFTIFIHAEEDGEDDYKNTTDGLWHVENGKIIISYTNGVKNIFKTFDCLSYVEFGGKGCSFGLKLVDGTLKKSDVLYRYGFWRVGTLKKVER
jgi:hypothetical protein